MNPEDQAREIIDDLLEQAGWRVQGPGLPNFRAGRGIALREVSLTTGFADYLLFVDGKALGVIEAKKMGTVLVEVELQSDKYSRGVKQPLEAWREPLPFLYESTGKKTYFTNRIDPTPRSRRVFAFHRPETLLRWVQEEKSLRGRFHELPPLLTQDLWDPQVRAINNLEESLKKNYPRALIQMATGSGKTFTAVNFTYRFVRFADARRILFLVDRKNLGEQALGEFQSFDTPDDGRKFTDLYNTRHLTDNFVLPDEQDVNRVYISTIQRIYSILKDEELEERYNDSLYESFEEEEQEVRTVSYNEKFPIEFFDIIIIDECHRSIYNLWRQVLEYFDAHLIGLTATPSAQTVGFFKENLVMQYDHDQAVADGINVPGEVYPIRTEITANGATIATGEFVTEKNRLTDDERRRMLDEDLTYNEARLGRDVMNESQIRLVLRTFRDDLFTKIFPDRTGEHVPKTLIFAKNDNHANDIVRIAREVFEQGNDFCQKVTYKLEKGKKPKDLVSAFRTKYYPRIAVTVDMIATGTDIKPIECLIFMRVIRDRGYFQQMYGRGTRIISDDDLTGVTADAPTKDHFVLIDAVGITDEGVLIDTAPNLNRKRSTTLPDLLKNIAFKQTADEDTLATLISRLSRLNRKLENEDQQALQDISGRDLPTITKGLMRALDGDEIQQRAREIAGADEDAELPEETIEEAAAQLRDEVIDELLGNDPTPLFEKLTELYERTIITYDESNLDRLITSGFDEEATTRARDTISSFRQYIEENRDRITALKLIYNQQYDEQQVTFDTLKELAEQIAQPPHNWTTEKLWRAYQRLEKAKTRPTSDLTALTNLVTLVRHTLRPEDATLEPYPELVQQRYVAWLVEQQQAGKQYTPEQQWWLNEIAKHIGINWAITPSDLQEGEFADKGGLFKAMDVLGKDWQDVLAEMNAALVVL